MQTMEKRVGKRLAFRADLGPANEGVVRIAIGSSDVAWRLQVRVTHSLKAVCAKLSLSHMLQDVGGEMPNDGNKALPRRRGEVGLAHSARREAALFLEGLQGCAGHVDKITGLSAVKCRPHALEQRRRALGERVVVVWLACPRLYFFCSH